MRNTNPQRLAWITLVGGLVIFCLLCAGTVIFARWLLFESPTDLSVMLHVGRGTVGVAEPDSSGEKAVRGSEGVSAGSTLRTDNDSQGYLEVSDPYSGTVIATVMLRGNSAIRLKSANRPRFSLSENAYVVRLDGASGRLDVWVNDDLDREIRLEIKGPLGITRIDQGGRLTISSTTDNMVVTVQEGNATLVTDEHQAQHLASNTEGTIQLGNRAIQVGPGPVELVLNSRFDEGGPVGWGCSNDLSGMDPNAPVGEYTFPTVDGRSTTHLTRLQPNPGHGETGCVQYLADREQGLDITRYESLQLRVTMQVHHQSLSACGIAGSECPVMIYMQYLDTNGNRFDWYHGFYAELRPNEAARKICDSCLEEHEFINKDAWYTYESGNLFTDLPEDRRPGSIILIEFYASGHQYEVMLDEVALLASPARDAQP